MSTKMSDVKTAKVIKNGKTNSKINTLSAVVGSIKVKQEADRQAWMKENSTFIRGENGETVLVTFAGTFEQREQVFTKGRPAIAVLDFDAFKGQNPEPKFLSWIYFPGKEAQELTDKLIAILGDKFTGKKIEFTYGPVGNNGKIGVVDLREVT